MTTTLARGLLISAWLSLVVAIPVPQGGGGGGDTTNGQGQGQGQGIGGNGGGQGGGGADGRGRIPRGRGEISDYSYTSSELSDSIVSVPEQPDLFSRGQVRWGEEEEKEEGGGEEPGTRGYLRSTAQTRQMPSSMNNNDYYNNNYRQALSSPGGGVYGSPMVYVGPGSAEYMLKHGKGGAGTIGIGGTIGSRGGTGGVPNSGSVGGRSGGLDTSLRKNFPGGGGGSPPNSGRIQGGSNNYNSNNLNSPTPSTFNNRLAPGMFSQPPEGSQSGWPWEYIERLPSPPLENSLGFSGVAGGIVKSPQYLYGPQDQTRLSSPYGSNPPSVRFSGMQEGIYRNSGQLGSTFSRERKLVPQLTTPLGSSKYVSNSPNKTKNTPGNTGRGTLSPHQSSRNNGGSEEGDQEEVRQGFVESFRSQYPEFAETIEFVTDGDKNYSPEKKILEEFKFTTTNPTPRIVTPPLVDFGRFGAGVDRGKAGAGAGRGANNNNNYNNVADKMESDLLPVDLENILAQYTYADTEEDDNNDNNNNENNNGVGWNGGAGTKASCDVTEGDCTDGIGGRESLPLAAQVTRANGNFEVRNPGRVAGLTGRGGAGTNRAVPTTPGGNGGSPGGIQGYPSMKGPRITLED
ncbi:hypothetical protein TWF569_006381 [Orbilia oligospora]|nr:hypothetical protein TWF569_006381 [Orbilia oligospora]